MDGSAALALDFADFALVGRSIPRPRCDGRQSLHNRPSHRGDRREQRLRVPQLVADGKADAALFSNAKG